jgi:hypothetical protein
LKFRELYQAILFNSPESDPLKHILYNYFTKHFVSFAESQEEHQLRSQEEHQLQSLEEHQLQSSFEDFCIKLHKLNLISISEEIFSEILFHQIELQLDSSCKGNFEEPCLGNITQWMDSVVYKWLEMILLPSPGMVTSLIIVGYLLSLPELASRGLFLQWKTRLEFFVCEAFADLRIGELFSIIVDFPDSTPAILDLKECLAKTNQHAELITSLKRAYCYSTWKFSNSY